MKKHGMLHRDTYGNTVGEESITPPVSQVSQASQASQASGASHSASHLAAESQERQ